MLEQVLHDGVKVILERLLLGNERVQNVRHGGSDAKGRII